MIDSLKQRPKPATNTDEDIHLAEAERFLAALDPSAEVFCFQTFDDNPDRALKNKKLSWCDTGTFGDLKSSLIWANNRHAGVFVAINPTDGRGRTKKNVTGVRAIMLDLDGTPIDPVLECPLKPHIITETSPGHYHVFWRVDGLSLDRFEDVQRGLAKRFDGDPAVATPERCTRLPGFFHCKDIENRFRVRVITLSEHAAYKAEEVLETFPPEQKAHKAAKSDGRIVLPAGAPLPAAEAFLQHQYSAGDIPLLWSYRGGFYRWTGTHYREHADETLEHELYRYLHGALVTSKNGTVAPFNPTKHKVQEIVHALRRCSLVSRDWDTPCWLGTNYYRPAANLVACHNGILNLETRQIQPHDPLFFTTSCLPLDYDRAAPEPKRWLQFIAELWPEDKEGNWDKEAEGTLQEIAGYLLTSDTRQQKIFLVIGPPRCGKGTIVHVLVQMLGDDNCVFPTLSSLGGEFGKWPLIDKKLAAITDARISSKADTHKVAELLLSISGGDRQTVNRKNQAFWTGRLDVRFLITTNVLPAIRDASGTIATRYILLKLTESFLGREDLELRAKLAVEMGGILNWALDGLDRLRKRGHFRMPASSQESIRELEDAAEPVRAFLREWCKRGASQRVNVKTFYRNYRAWAEEAGQQILAKNSFGRALRGQLPKLKTTGVGAKRDYVGIALSEHGQEQFDTLMQEKGQGRR
jgi:putative DNA primase/helicase